jgi:hypothetical protein
VRVRVYVCTVLAGNLNSPYSPLFPDDVILLVKSSKDQAAARVALTSAEYGLSLDQVTYISLCYSSYS